ncbi:LOW QUALITY PROTEIN: hypothetical protein U9M48_028629 [Paspalum notatum var. saurae]|uniref:Uncharacterized protein n=1 Tax=Paspalum notatum var. saurae TaxID=547442 RepID=A0AAQ3U1M4_PASNO
MHVCPNDCILYHGKELEDLEACSECKVSRYKIRRDDPSDVEGECPRKRVPTNNKENAKMVHWHKEDHTEDDMLRHPTWIGGEKTYLEFADDARNIRFGLSMEGMDPFREMSSSHSTWPITLRMYNLPP